MITGCAVSETDLICSANTTTNVQNWGIIVGYDESVGMSSISDCVVTNSTISSTTCNFTGAGIIAGKITGNAPIDGCTVTGCSITSGLATTTKTYDIGGIIGNVNSGSGSVSNCTVTNTNITVKGPKGTLEREIHPNISLKMDGNVINVIRKNDEPKNNQLTLYFY